MGKSTTMVSSKKQFRVGGNRKMVEAVMNGEVSSAMYAKIMNPLGNCQMRIYYEHNKIPHEGIATIRGLFRKNKSQVPIRTNDIVIVEPLETGNKHFLITGVLNSKDIALEVKEHNIPEYFLNDIVSNDFTKKQMKDGFEFDYTEDVDVDTI